MGVIRSRWPTLALGLLFVMQAAGDWCYQVQKFDESPEIYYVDKGTVNL
jgi:hypothetical protein